VNRYESLRDSKKNYKASRAKIFNILETPKRTDQTTTQKVPIINKNQARAQRARSRRQINRDFEDFLPRRDNLFGGDSNFSSNQTDNSQPINSQPSRFEEQITENQRLRFQNKKKSMKLISDPSNPISHNTQKSPTKGYPKKHNYIPRKAQAAKPTTELKRDEMTLEGQRKHDLEKKLLECQIRRDQVSWWFKGR
jgi:hypothetical protein